MYVLYNARRGHTFHAPYCSNTCTEKSVTHVLSRRKWSPATTGPARPSMADLVAIDGPAGPCIHGCHGWSALPQVVPHEFCYR